MSECVLIKFQFQSNFDWQSLKFVQKMTSVERITEYMDLNKEEYLDIGKTSFPENKWPTNGEIQFNSVSYAYDKDLPNVLKNVSFKIGSQEKIGIIGRTGAGKSTIFQSIFRMAEPDGEILIDNVNINQLSLHALRSKISIIPV
jgi:ATP-binding cassette subfamily C (CFTR/MRP) protein 4